MKAEVMGRIDRAGRDDIDEDATVIPLFRRAAPWIAAAAAVAALVFVIGLGPATEQERIEAILASEDAVSVVVDADIVVFAEIVYIGSGDAVFSATGLSDVPATETYQLWLIGDEGPVSAGVFHPDAEGGALVLLDGRVEPGLVLGLTVEPSGGSEAPTGDILIAQEV
jgi:anti-sigma-K factor RskA